MSAAGLATGACSCCCAATARPAGVDQYRKRGADDWLLGRIQFTHMQTWQRPTLPRLKTKYHRRRGVSRPSSEWDRVQPPRHYHQVGVCVNMTSGFFRIAFEFPNALAVIYGEHCLMRAIKSIELLVPVSYTPCSASTPGLSTRSSSSALEGELVLR